MLKLAHQWPERTELLCTGNRLLLVTLITLFTTLFTATSIAFASEQTVTKPTTTVQSQPAETDTPLPKGVDPQTGFRMQRYRAPVPEIIPGAETVTTQRALVLHQTEQVIFIDVYPPRGLGADPLDGSWMISESREHISSSIWLPEVGQGHLEPQQIDYFERNLIQLSKGNTSTPLLFYCTADCWQSWNAARRARLWGYHNVFWYPDGTDGWTEEDLPVVAAEPVNFLGEYHRLDK